MNETAPCPSMPPVVLALILVGCPGDDGGPAAAGSSTSTAGSSTTAEPEGTSTGGSTSGVADSTGSSSGSTGDTEASTGTTGPGIVDAGCPECTVLVDGLVGGRGLSIHGDFVYITDQEAGTVLRVPKDGGEVEELVDLQSEPYDVVATDEHVFWTTFVEGGSVWRAVLPDGSPIALSADDYPRMLQIYGGYVYWCAFDDVEGRVRRVPTTGIGQAPETLVAVGSGVADLVVADDLVYFTGHDPPAKKGLAPPGAVYVASALVPTDLVDLTVLAPEQAEPWGIAMGGDTVFWVNGIGDPPDLPHRVLSLPSAGMVNPTVLATDQTAPWGIAADDSHIYWTDYTEVEALPHAGGDPILLGRMQTIARSIVEDGDDLYWITRERLLRRPKP